MSHETVLGVDIGGSHITAALVDLQTKSLLAGTQARAQVNSQGTVQEVLQAWSAVMTKVMGALNPADVKIGISIPGPFDYEAGICLFQNQNKYDCLYGLNVKELLAAQLNSRVANIKLANDAGCFMKGEVFGGAARNTASALGLTLGTGLGSATFEHGMAADADLWHAPFKNSMAEDYLSTRALVRAYQTFSGKTVADVKELSGLYSHDVAAREVFEEFAENLALFLAPYLREKQPEVLIIGGNIANAWDLFMPAAIGKLASWGIEVPVKRAALAEEAALIGAASYWHNEAMSIPESDNH